MTSGNQGSTKQDAPHAPVKLLWFRELVTIGWPAPPPRDALEADLPHRPGDPLPVHALLANARQTVEAARNVKDDRVLAGLPFSHLFGLTVSAIVPLLVGAGRLGVPLPGVEIGIRHPESGAELPVGTDGGICVRGEMPGVHEARVSAIPEPRERHRHRGLGVGQAQGRAVVVQGATPTMRL